MAFEPSEFLQARTLLEISPQQTMSPVGGLVDGATCFWNGPIKKPALPAILSCGVVIPVAAVSVAAAKFPLPSSVRFGSHRVVVLLNQGIAIAPRLQFTPPAPEPPGVAGKGPLDAPFTVTVYSYDPEATQTPQ